MSLKKGSVRLNEWRRRRVLQEAIREIVASIVKDIDKDITKYRKSMWVRPFLQQRKVRGDFYVAVPDMIRDDPGYFFDTFRMSPSTFEELLGLIGHRIDKKDVGREPISPSERLMITLAYLVSGDEQKSIAKDYRVGRATVCHVVHDTCEALYDALRDIVLRRPDEQKWKTIANRFESAWQFPNCVGAIDGKHFKIPKPGNSGSHYYNYKGYHSVVMLALCDADYKFTYVNVGAAGSESDGGIFRRSELGWQILDGSHDFPESSILNGSDHLAEHVVVGDEAFPLLPNLMRPYSGRNLTHDQRIFSYRLSRARRIIENTFGILVVRWRLLNDTVNMKPDYAKVAILACVVLHNWIRNKAELRSSYTPASFVDGEDAQGNLIAGAWRNAVSPDNLGLAPRSHNPSLAAKTMRDKFTAYFVNEGVVSWQENSILDY